MLSSIGLPALNGFVGEFLILLGSFQVDYLFGGLATFGVVLSAVYLLYPFRRVFFGECLKEENRRLTDLRLREIFVLAPILVLIFLIGLYPKPFLSRIEPATNEVVRRVAITQLVMASPGNDEGVASLAQECPFSLVPNSMERTRS
jgi:NADH-quinone oxidoreductase subunit M